MCMPKNHWAVQNPIIKFKPLRRQKGLRLHTQKLHQWQLKKKKDRDLVKNASMILHVRWLKINQSYDEYNNFSGKRPKFAWSSGMRRIVAGGLLWSGVKCLWSQKESVSAGVSGALCESLGAGWCLMGRHAVCPLRWVHWVPYSVFT